MNEIKLTGADDLKRWLDAFPKTVHKDIMQKGMLRAASRLRTLMRRRAPRGETGKLRRGIDMRRRRNGGVLVGLLGYTYYGVLDKGRKSYVRKSGVKVRGTPDFDSIGTGVDEVWEANKEQIAQMIIDQAKLALAREAGRLYAQTNSRR